MSRRTDRVEDLLRQELSTLLLREVHDPRTQGAVVTSVDVTPNLAMARVAVSVLGSEEKRVETVAALNHAAGFLRRQLGARLRLKVIPELRFDLDRGAEASLRIAELLEEERHDDHDDPAS